MTLTTSKTIRMARAKLDELIPMVRKGDFIQIERVDSETRKSLSIVAYRNTGDQALFQKKINLMFNDACDALNDGQGIKVYIDVK